MNNFFPPIEVFITLEPEEAGPYLFIYLKDFMSHNRSGKIHRSHLINSSSSEVRDYAGDALNQVLLIISEAWAWLETQGFLVPCPEAGSDGRVCISRRGQKIETLEAFKKFEHVQLLNRDLLDPVLSDKIWPIFIRGDFDTSIFAAFKEVEVRMRKAAKLGNTTLGVELAREAFNPEKGELTDIDNPSLSERQAYAHLFAGAIGAFKNPGSHRDVNYDDPKVATSLILFANTLIQIIDRRATVFEEREAENLKIQASV